MARAAKRGRGVGFGRGPRAACREITRAAVTLWIRRYLEVPRAPRPGGGWPARGTSTFRSAVRRAARAPRSGWHDRCSCGLAMTSHAIEAQSTAARPARSSLAAALAHLGRARLVQFLAIGGAIFFVAPRPRDDRRIEVAGRELAIAAAAEATRHGARALAPDKAAEVKARLIEDKLLYQEGVRLGLDQDDPIIRQRVIQKVLLLAEDLGGATRAPTRAELRAAYARTAERYRQPARYHVMHVFTARRDDLPPPDRLELGALPAAGEPFPLPRETRATHDELRQAYGAEFATAVAAQPVGGGYGPPVASSFGWHRVRVVDVAPGGIQPFEQVERQVGFDLMLQRREDTMRRFLDQLVARYQIVIDGAPLAGFTPSMRLARHEVASGED